MTLIVSFILATCALSFTTNCPTVSALPAPQTEPLRLDGLINTLLQQIPTTVSGTGNDILSNPVTKGLLSSLGIQLQGTWPFITRANSRSSNDSSASSTSSNASVQVDRLLNIVFSNDTSAFSPQLTELIGRLSNSVVTSGRSLFATALPDGSDKRYPIGLGGFPIYRPVGGSGE